MRRTAYACLSLFLALPLAAVAASTAIPPATRGQALAGVEAGQGLQSESGATCSEIAQTAQIPALLNVRNADTIVDCDMCGFGLSSPYRQCKNSCGRGYDVYQCQATYPGCQLASCICMPV
jgi:hypothetical protein